MIKKNVQEKNKKPSSQKVNPLLHSEKNKREIIYHRKHTKVDKHKVKGKNKIGLRDERSGD